MSQRLAACVPHTWRLRQPWRPGGHNSVATPSVAAARPLHPSPVRTYPRVPPSNRKWYGLEFQLPVQATTRGWGQGELSNMINLVVLVLRGNRRHGQKHCNHCGSNFVPLLLFVAQICWLISLVLDVFCTYKCVTSLWYYLLLKCLKRLFTPRPPPPDHVLLQISNFLCGSFRFLHDISVVFHIIIMVILITTSWTHPWLSFLSHPLYSSFFPPLPAARL